MSQVIRMANQKDLPGAQEFLKSSAGEGQIVVLIDDHAGLIGAAALEMIDSRVGVVRFGIDETQRDQFLEQELIRLFLALVATKEIELIFWNTEKTPYLVHLGFREIWGKTLPKTIQEAFSECKEGAVLMKRYKASSHDWVEEFERKRA